MKIGRKRNEREELEVFPKKKKKKFGASSNRLSCYFRAVSGGLPGCSEDKCTQQHQKNPRCVVDKSLHHFLLHQIDVLVECMWLVQFAWHRF